jgi:hypothetical protein
MQMCARPGSAAASRLPPALDSHQGSYGMALPQGHSPGLQHKQEPSGMELQAGPAHSAPMRLPSPRRAAAGRHFSPSPQPQAQMHQHAQHMQHMQQQAQQQQQQQQQAMMETYEARQHGQAMAGPAGSLQQGQEQHPQPGPHSYPMEGPSEQQGGGASRRPPELESDYIARAAQMHNELQAKFDVLLAEAEQLPCIPRRLVLREVSSGQAACC